MGNAKKIYAPRFAHFPSQTLDAKKEWNSRFEDYIRVLDKKKPVVWGGDLNVAPTAMGDVFLCYFIPGS